MDNNAEDAEATNDNVQSTLLKTRDLNTAATESSELALHDGKLAHMFVSYSSDDRDIIHPIIADLEKNHGVICIFDDRDFLPGMEIHKNIKRGMEKSMKILLFLTENFLKSGYCKYETDLAFVLSMESGGNNVIPVMLETCRVPNTLKTLTYVDATKEETNLAAKVVDAYKNADKDALPSHFERLAQASNKPMNGECFSLNCTVEKSCCLRPAKKYLELDHMTLDVIQEANFTVTADVLKHAIAVVNSYYTNSLLAKTDPLVLVGFSMLYIPLAFGTLFFATAVAWATRLSRFGYRGSWEPIDASEPEAVLLLLFPGIPVAILFVWVGSMLQRNWSFNRFTKHVYDQITSVTYKDGVVFEIVPVKASMANGFRRSFVLRIIRYDIEPCLNYLESKINTLHASDGAEIEKQPILQEAVDALVCSQLPDYCAGFSALTDVPVNRHRVKGGKACFCQVAEKHLVAHRPKSTTSRQSPV